MRRIFSDYAYGPGPRSNCWWDETIAAPDWPVLQGEGSADVAIIGGGFTGVSAALHLAESGLSVAVLEAETPGWGASGRNGGFCCLGGSKLSGSAMRRLFGKPAADTYDSRRRSCRASGAGAAGDPWHRCRHAFERGNPAGSQRKGRETPAGTGRNHARCRRGTGLPDPWPVGGERTERHFSCGADNAAWALP